MTIVLSVKQAGKSRPLHPNCPPGVLSISFIAKTADRPKIARFGYENFNSSPRQLFAVVVRQTGNSRPSALHSLLLNKRRRAGPSADFTINAESNLPGGLTPNLAIS
jgi:hypothetical protein